MEQINLFAIFMTGLLAGGLSCLAVQGGLLATTIAQREEDKLLNIAGKTSLSDPRLSSRRTRPALRDSVPIMSFLVAKLIAYTLLGFLLGLLGSAFTLSIQLQVAMQIFVALFMLATALNMLNVHPIFRYVVVQPPRFLTRYIRQQSKRKDIFAPAVLGAFTVFIPCGTTQAMMALAIGSASPVMGSLVLFSFVLGTSPLFFLLGYFASRLSGVLQERFMKVAGVALILLSLYTLNNAFTLTGGGYNLQSLFAFGSSDSRDIPQNTTNLSNEVTIEVVPDGYKPSVINVRGGEKVKLHIVNKEAIGCQQAFVIPSLGYRAIIRPGKEETVEFDAPKTSGRIAFMCTMGMYQGVINVL